MTVYITNPLTDPRWQDLASRHPRASVFHQCGWLEALKRTYGYDPIAVTTSPPGQPLENGIVLCRISSWITGRRLVSLPFSDHCDPLVCGSTEAQPLVNLLEEMRGQGGYRYVELRPLTGLLSLPATFREIGTYCFHKLELAAPIQEIYRGLHKNSIQRKIQRAEREKLGYEAGRSERLLQEFYRLLVRTRRRHRLFPQPIAWFHNLFRCMGERVVVRIARQGELAIAALLSISHANVVVYKYGCSDERMHNLGGMPFLFWKMIEESKTSGAQWLDLGRTDVEQRTLIQFKERFGAVRSMISYQRLGDNAGPRAAKFAGADGVRKLMPVLPDAMLSALGRLAYRHLG